MVKEAEFYRKKLDNGVTVLFEPRKIPVVSVSTSVKFGAQYESPEIKGVSHFIEHLVFKGTKNRTVDQISEAIENRGGVLNAFTGEEVTCFWNKLPSKHFSLGADISRDLVLNPLFEKEALERERKVVLEEIKMYHDNPSSHVMEKIKEVMYKSPFGLPILGTSETVSKLSREKIVKVFDPVYSGNNLIFCVVGDSNFDSVLNEAKKFPKKISAIKRIPIIPKNGEVTETREGLDQAHLVFGTHLPNLSQKDRYACEILDSFLTGGMSSVLFKEVREKRGLCYSIHGILDQSKDYAHELIYTGTTKENVKEIKEIILREFKNIKFMKQADLNVIKERLIGLRKISREKSDSTMINLLQEELAGNAEEYYKYDERINAVKLSDVQNLSKLKGFSFVSLLPKKK